MRESYVTSNGIRLYAVEQGKGPAVLLVHGFPEHWWSWRHQLGALADAGYRAVAVDLPGYGLSDKPDRRYDEPWVNECLAGVVRALGAERCVIAGHDWGGLLVWPFARRYPGLLAGVVGVNTPDLPRSDIPPVQLMRQIFGEQPPYIVQFQHPGAAELILGRDIRGFMELMLKGPATTRTEVFGDPEIDRFAEPFRAHGSLSPPLDYYRCLDRNWQVAADLPERIDTPALMISAANDPVLTPAMSEGMEARVPNLTRALIEDCGHWTQQEQPEATNRALLGFLDGLDRWS